VHSATPFPTQDDKQSLNYLVFNVSHRTRDPPWDKGEDEVLRCGAVLDRLKGRV
jgi:hypothetical protein